MGETENKNTDSERISIKQRRKNNQRVAFGDIVSENKSMLLLFAVIVVVLAVILISILRLDMSVVSVCAIVLLEVGLAVCLHDVPIWLHALVIIAQIVVGVLCASTVFMILCAVIYLAGIFTLRFIRD